MAKISIVFGVLLAAVGIAGFAMTGYAHKTALIPTWLGCLLIVMAVLAIAKPNLNKHAMHVNVLFALLGFLVASGRLIPGLIRGEGTAASRLALGGMSLLTFIYVILCVRSFITARRNRTAETPA
jgi:hypothetical protein